MNILDIIVTYRHIIIYYIHHYHTSDSLLTLEQQKMCIKYKGLFFQKSLCFYLFISSSLVIESLIWSIKWSAIFIFIKTGYSVRLSVSIWSIRPLSFQLVLWVMKLNSFIFGICHIGRDRACISVWKLMHELAAFWLCIVVRYEINLSSFTFTTGLTWLVLLYRVVQLNWN